MITRETLDNGIRLATETMGHVRSVSIGVWLTRGSRHETEAEGGAYVEYKAVLRRVLEGFGVRLGFAPTEDELRRLADAAEAD